MKNNRFLLHALSWAMLPLFLFCSLTISAQGFEKIQLLNQQDKTPIVAATFQYDTQLGLSDENGWIEFRLVENAVLAISHLSFGERILTDTEVQAAIKSQQFYWAALPQNLQPVTIIALHPKMDEIEKLGLDYQDKMAHDGGAILNQTPLINSIRKGGNYGFDPVLRGFKYDQLNIVLNGTQSATAACPNRMDPPTSQMAPNMMERIEVLKGPHALRFGNSFGATINFISAPARYSDTQNIYGRFSGGFEENGSVLRSEGMIGFSGKRYDLGLFASWSQGDDYTDGDDNTVAADFQRGSFGTNLNVKLSSNQEVSFSATRNLARDADFPSLQMDLREDDTWMLNAAHKITFENPRLKSWSTTAYGTFVDHLMDNLLKPLDPRMLNANTLAKTRTYGGRTEGTWQTTKGTLYVGADFRGEAAEGNRVREFLLGPNAGKTFTDNAWQKGRISKTGLFSEYHLRGGGIQFVFSGRLEVNQSDITDVATEFTEVYDETDATQINPSLSIGGIKNYSNDIALGLWLGRASRSGSLTERFINYFPVGQDPYEMLGNPQLDPEINNQVDFTFSYKTTTTALNVDVFAAYLQNNISSVIDTTLSPRLPNSPGVRQFLNIEEAFKTGFEISWLQSFGANLKNQLSLAYTYGQDLEREEALPEIAPLDIRYRLFGDFLKNKLRPEVSLRYVMEQDRISSEFGETETPSFVLLDASVQYHFTKNFSLTTGVQNILDETYYEHLNRSVKGTTPYPLYARGRNVFLSLVVEFE